MLQGELRSSASISLILPSLRVAKTIRGEGFSASPGGIGRIDLRLALFEQDEQTAGIVMVGEIGGNAEELAADYIRAHVGKPVVAYIAGVTAPPGKRMGHAGAIISGGGGTAEGKYAALEAAGVATVRSPADIGRRMAELLRGA